MCKMPELSFYFIFFLQIHNAFVGFIKASEINNDVKIEVLFTPENCVKKSKRGDLLNAHYDGYLEDGSKIYCSRSIKEGHPQWFVLGVGQVLKGIDIGMNDMCPGEKRKITVPPSLAFGEKGKDPVPPNATVIFEVELYGITRGPRSIEAFREMDLDGDTILTKTEVKQHLKIQEKKSGNELREESYYDDVTADVFRMSDHNGDGTLSLKEYNVYEHDEL